MFDKNRFLSMTDAIVAVAATIMVLKLNIPEHASLEAAKEQFPVLLAYIISFIQIFLDWHEHHDTFRQAEKINHRVFLVNCIWLMTVTLIPFVTGMVGQNTSHTASLIVYIVILCLEQLVLMAESRMVGKLNAVTIQDADVIRTTRIVTLSSYGLAAVTAVFASQVSLPIILAGIAVNIVIICLYDKKHEGTES